MASNFEDVAKQFVNFYYAQFDNDRKQLGPLYRENSMLTFESSASLGGPAIVEKLAALPFQSVKHQVSTLDAQPSVNGGVLVLVTGQLLVDEEQRPMNYAQAFQLMPDGNNSFFVFNDVFKLVYG
ncbi:nuclear transport factor 2 [Xylariales sp. PMI_506]|nr:nuclear transport factor 2 [Xylariales sp. PMI_506]